MKKIYAILIFLIIAVSSVSVIYAASEQIGGYSFNIPAGFKEVDSNQNYEDHSTIYTKTFKNSKGDIINITVEENNPGSTFTSLSPGPNFDQKTLAGNDGIYTSSSPTTHLATFKFIADGGERLVEIEATNPKDIEACLS